MNTRLILFFLIAQTNFLSFAVEVKDFPNSEKACAGTIITNKNLFSQSTEAAAGFLTPVLERRVLSPSTTTSGRLYKCGVGLGFEPSAQNDLLTTVSASKSFVRVASSVSTASRNDSNEMPSPESSGIPYTFRALRSESPCSPSASATLKTGSKTAAATETLISKKKYDLGSLIDLALNNNPSTRASWSQAKAASASIGEARALYYPWVRSNFVGGYDYNYLPTASGPNIYSRNQATIFLSMEYILLDFGRRDADVRRTVATFQALGWTYQRNLQETIFALQKAYFTHEAALWRKKSAEANLIFAQTLSTMISRENETGLSAEPEVLKARKRVLEVQYELEASIAAVLNTQGELCIVVGLPANSPLEIAETEPPVSTKKLRGDANELISRALLLRPDLAARAAEVRASKEATKRAVADFFPVVKLEGQYANSTFGYTGSDSLIHGTYNRNFISGYSGFVTVHWDLFDGFERIFRVRRRQEEDKVAQKNLEQLQLNATRDVWTAYNNSISAAQRVGYAEGFVASAKESLNAMSAAVNTGLTNVTDYSEAGSNLSFAQSELATAVADYSTTLASLALAVGTSTPTSGTVRQKFGDPGKLTGHLITAEEGTIGKNG